MNTFSFYGVSHSVQTFKSNVPHNSGPRAGLDSAEQKNLFPLPEIQTQILGRPIRSLVTTLTELSPFPGHGLLLNPFA